MSKATGFDRPLTIAVASGKGGTGKTTLSVALALCAPGGAVLLDCDVEEPNAALFLAPQAAGAVVSEIEVTVPVPVLEEAKCVGCGACAKMCRYNAIVVIKRETTIFVDLCHSCGGCALVCPERAITEEPRRIGAIREWSGSALGFAQGELDVGRSMSPPLIRAVKKRAAALSGGVGGFAAATIIDCPPGTSCPVVTAARGADFALLVTEPTPFGLHDLMLAVETIRKMGLPFGVAVNRCDVGDDRVVRYCEAEGIPVMAQIPNDRRVAEAYSSGGTLLSAGESYRRIVEGLFDKIAACVREARP